MSKYWAENKQIQNRGFLIAKIISLGSFGILIYVAGQEQILDFIATLNVPTILLKNCTAGCNFLWTIGLFILFCIYWLVLLFVLIKPPKGFWVNFLLVFWGGVGFLFLSDVWDYSWRPDLYRFTNEQFSYSEYISRGVLIWIWCVIGILQTFLPPRARKYVVSIHMGISILIVSVGGIVAFISGKM